MRDIKLALMYEAHRKFSVRGFSANLEKVNEVNEFLSEVEDEDENYDFTEECVDEEWCWSRCSCNDCDQMNVIEDRWAEWEPPTPVLAILKKSIDRI